MPALVSYMIATSVIGLVVVVRAFSSGALPDIWTVFLFLGLGMVGEHLFVRLPSGSLLPLTETATFAALWSFGLPLALVSVIIPTFSRVFTHKKALLNSVFNASQTALSLSLADLIVRTAVPSSQPPFGQVVFVLLMIISYDVLNVLFVAAAFAIDGADSLFRLYVNVAYSDRKNSLLVWYLVNAATTLLTFHLGRTGVIFVSAGILALWNQIQSEKELRTKSIEARTDTLTGLNNLRYLERWLNFEFPKLVAQEAPCSVIFVDVDDLKIINDSKGHDAGDTALVHLARVLKSVVRAGDKIVRYGGDEFVILLQNTSVNEAEAVGLRILEALDRDPVTYEGDPLEVSLSLGVSSYPRHTGLGRDLIRIADKAMYLAKKAGGNAVCTADSL